MEYIIIAIVAVALIVAAFFAGIQYRKKVGEAQIGAAETKAREIIDDALKSADAKKREVLLEAKEEALRMKNDLEMCIRDSLRSVEGTGRTV